jgi:hypothetical protein
VGEGVEGLSAQGAEGQADLTEAVYKSMGVMWEY